MTHLPPPPPEPPVITDTTQLAPKFLVSLGRVLMALDAAGWHPVVRESLRTDERAAWLYGFGRDYDDGRGIVTYAPNGLKTWHHFHLAVDLGDKRYDSGNEPAEFFTDLGAIALREELTWGGGWRMRDLPHIQWGPPMRNTPSDEAAALLASGGVEAVWRAVGAD